MGNFRLIFRFGTILLKLCPFHLATYVLLSFLTQTAIPLALPVVLGQLTNSLPKKEPTDKDLPKSPVKRGTVSSVRGATNSSPSAQLVHTDHGALDRISNTHLVRPYLVWLLLAVSLIPLNIGFRVAQTKADNRMEKYLRLSLFDQVMLQPPEFFRGRNPAEFTNILTQTAVEAQQAARQLTIDPFLQFVSLFVASWLIVYELRTLRSGVVAPVIAVMVLLGSLSVVLIQVKSGRRIYRTQSDVQQQRFALIGIVDSAVKAPEEIQAMGSEELFRDKYEAGLKNLMELKERQVFNMEFVNSALGLPTLLILSGLYGLIIQQALAGTAYFEPGIFVALAGLAPQLMQPFRAFAAIGVVASSSWPAVELVTNLLNAESRFGESASANSLKRLDATLEVKNLWFSYPGESKPMFSGLNFKVSPGTITGLVGRMGEGKSTFFKMALRSYDPDAGMILLGGMPITSMTRKTVIAHVGMMSQFPVFFHESIRDNFRIAKLDATDFEIQTVCETTKLWHVLLDVFGPSPLDRPFDCGSALSGGQKRLFALTRSLLRNPTFLLIDEPTTNMDKQEIYSLIQPIRRACSGKTLVIIDHDVEWLTQICDRFVVLNNGRIAQQGTSSELLAAGGLFKELLQPAHVDSRPVDHGDSR